MARQIQSIEEKQQQRPAQVKLTLIILKYVVFLVFVHSWVFLRMYSVQSFDTTEVHSKFHNKNLILNTPTASLRLNLILQ